MTTELDPRTLPWNLDKRPESRDRMESSSRRLLAMGKTVDEVHRMYGVPHERLEELATQAPVVNRSEPPQPGYVLPPLDPTPPAAPRPLRMAPTPPLSPAPTQPPLPALIALDRAKSHEKAGIRSAAVRAEKALDHMRHLLAEADKAEREKAQREEEQQQARQRQQRERAEAERKLAELEEQTRAAREQLAQLRKGTSTRLTKSDRPKREMTPAQRAAIAVNLAKGRAALAAKRAAAQP